MRKFAFSAIAVLLVFQFSIMTVFASTYEVSNDTEVSEIYPIYYTENYEPGMITAMREAGIGNFAIRGYGSYSAVGWNPILSVEGASGSSALRYPTSEAPSVTVGTNSVTAQYTFSYNSSFNSALLFMSGSSNPYFDFQSNDIAFSQDTPDANTFVLNGTLRFTLGSYWSVFTGASTASFYTSLDPVGIQLLVDGKAYGDVIDISSYTSPFTGAFTSTSPAVATVTFNNLKIYGPNVTPELIGFRVYCDSNYSSGTRSFTGGSGIVINQSNTFSFNTLPTISFVSEATSSDTELGALSTFLQNGLFNSNNVPFLDVVISFLQDGLINSAGIPFLQHLTYVVGGNYLDTNGTVSSLSSGQTTLSNIIRNGFLGLRYLMVDDTGLSYFRALYANTVSYIGEPFLNLDGNSSSLYSVTSIARLLRVGFLGLSQNIKDFNSYLEDTTFSWQNYNLETHELDSAQTLTGQNAFFSTAFQSIEENLGRLAYVFASDDEIDLRDEADPSVTSFKDAFGGGVKAKDIGDVKGALDEVDTMFDTGISMDDMFDELGSLGGWFSEETFNNLDSTGSGYAVIDDDDTYNYHFYFGQQYQVDQIRNRNREREE